MRSATSSCTVKLAHAWIQSVRVLKDSCVGTSVIRYSRYGTVPPRPGGSPLHQLQTCSAGCCTPPVSESLKLGERILNSQILARTFEFCSRIASRGPYGTRNVNCEPLFFRARPGLDFAARYRIHTDTRSAPAPHARTARTPRERPGVAVPIFTK